MKRIIFCIGLILLIYWASSNPINPVKARHLAETFWQQSGCAARSDISANALMDITAQTEFSHLYIFSNAGGFVILSGDDCANPILAYSTCGGFNPENIPAAVGDWLFTYENRIEDAINQHLEATPEITSQWEMLQSGYWRDSNAMPNSCSSANNAVATLLYHCGVAIETNYTSSNSTAYVLYSPSHPFNAETALKEFFGYSVNAHGERRNNYDKATWMSMLKSNLDAGIPIIYNGYNSSYSGGHCFICDGYDANDFFHFNWGLRGNYDGFFEIDDMTPSNQNFSYDQGAIVDLIPATTEGIEENPNI